MNKWIIFTVGLLVVLGSVLQTGVLSTYSSVLKVQLELEYRDLVGGISNPNNNKPYDAITKTTKHRRMARYRDVYKYAPPSSSSSSTSNRTACGSEPDFGLYFKQPLQHRSVNSEDKTIYSLFREHHPDLGSHGTYIELGAFDGLTESNSRFFEECLGWTGLLVEGNPTKYAALLNNRPHAHRMSFAPSCTLEEEARNATIEFHAVAFTNGGLSGYANAYDKGHKLVNVSCGSLTPVLQDVFEGGHVHFFSLDVEGAEPLILKNIDFANVFIEAIMVESWNQLCPKEPAECRTREEAREIMKHAGYHLFNGIVQKSDLYIHPKSPLMNISAKYVW